MPFPFNPFGTAGRVGELDGPASSTDNAVVRWDGATGVLLQDSVVIVDDTGNVTGVVDLTATGTIDAAGYEVGGAALAHGDLAGVGEDDHHNAFEGLEDNAGATITPAADNRIQFTDDNKINVDAGGAGIIALSIDETQLSGIPESALAAAVQAQLVTNGDSHDHSGGDGGTIAHANLSGLANDDHTQYILASGARAMAGNLDLGTNNITNVGTVDGVDVSDHSARHESGGADAIKLDDLAAPDDNTDLDVSITAHGLAPKAPNDAAQFLDGTGSWSTPSGGSGVDVRQSILSADVDANGYCDIIGGTGTATATIEATDADLVMAWAQGYDTDGLPVDYTYAEDADKTVAMTAAAINYIFADYNAGSPTYSKTPYQPQYLEVEPSDGATFGAVLADFEGTDGDTTFTGAYGESWTFNGNAHIEQDAAKFGSTSVYLDGTGDSIEPTITWAQLTTATDGRWSVEGWFRFNDVTPAADQTLVMAANNAYAPWLALRSSGKLGLWLSSNGSAWDIASAQLSSNALAAADTFYHVALVFDGSAYKVYVDGALEITVASSTAVYPYAVNLEFGANNNGGNNPMAGYIDEIRISPFARYTAAFTAPSAAFTADDLYYFNIPEMKMYVGQPGSFVADTILFLGEAEVGADGDIDSVVSYAIRGRYRKDGQTYTANTWASVNHNLGVVPERTQVLAKCTTSDQGYPVGSWLTVHDQGDNAANTNFQVLCTRTNAKQGVGSAWRFGQYGSLGAGASMDLSDWEFTLICERGW